MNITKKYSYLFKIGFGLVGILIILFVLSFGSLRLITGHWFGLRSIVPVIVSLARSVNDSQIITSYSKGNYTNIIFLHHSVGRNLIDQGGVRERFTQAGYSFWDHDYNDPGLRGPDGQFSGFSFNVPDDNTFPDGLANIFNQRVFQQPVNTISGLLQYEVIIFKSCFPTSNISTDDQLEQDKNWYLEMRNGMDQYRDKIFIVVSQPPLNPAETTPEAADRARLLANWLKSREFLGGHPNIFTFDLFGYLAENNQVSQDYNMLRKAYQEGIDSHPNLLANETIGPIFGDFTISSIQSYRNGNVSH
jgi:hypothetical protein